MSGHSGSQIILFHPSKRNELFALSTPSLRTQVYNRLSLVFDSTQCVYLHRLGPRNQVHWAFLLLDKEKLLKASKWFLDLFHYGIEPLRSRKYLRIVTPNTWAGLFKLGIQISQLKKKIQLNSFYLQFDDWML